MAKLNKSRQQVSNRPDASFYEGEREREDCYVMGESDLLYGEASGFRQGITSTGARHKTSALGRKIGR